MPTRRVAPGPGPGMAFLQSPGAMGVVSTALAAVILLAGWPGLVVVWVAVIVHSWAVRPPLLSGAKGPDGRPTPATDAERDQVCAHTRAQARKTAATDIGALLPGAQMGAHQVGAWLCAVLASCVPQAWAWSRLVDAVAAALIVMAVTASRRAGADPVVARQPTPVADLIHAVTSAPRARVATGAVGAVVGALVGVGVVITARLPLWGRARTQVWEPVRQSWPVPDWATQPHGWPGWATVAVVAIIGMMVGWWPHWKARSRHHWRLLVDSHRMWAPVWERLKLSPAPVLVSVDEIIVGGEPVGVVETMRAHPDHVTQLPQRAATWVQGLGDTHHEIVILPGVATDATGQPLPGQRSTEVFRVVRWAGGAHPGVLDEGVDDATARLLVECAMAVHATGSMMPAPMVVSMTLATTDPGAHRVWLVDVTDPWGDSWQTIRTSMAPATAGWLSCQAVVDTAVKIRGQAAPRRLILGDLGTPDAAWDPQVLPIPDTHVPATPSVYVADLATEDRWSSAWRKVLKMGIPSPVIAHAMSSTKPLLLAHGARHDVSCAVFAIPQGVDGATTILSTEAALRTAITPRVADMTVTHLPDVRRGARPGDRNPAGVRVLSTAQALPSPLVVPPQGDVHVVGAQPESAARWMWTILLNRAFDAAKLARGEVLQQTCLTLPDSTEHIWEVHVRLYGAVTAKKLADWSNELRSTLHVPWVSVSDTPTGDAVLLIGADPVPADHETSLIVDQVFMIGDGDDLARHTSEQGHVLSGGVPVPPRMAPRRRGGPRVMMSVDAHTHIDDIVYRGWWHAAGVWAPNGARPALVSSEPVPTNPAVTQRVFHMPAGIGLPSLRAAVQKMKAASGNQFIDVRADPADASKAVVLFAKTDPMPRYAPYDMGCPATMDHIPFGVRTDGTVMSMDLSTFTHLLLTGTSNSGKSGSSMALLFSLLRAGCQVAVIDYSVKQAADFAAFEPWLVAVGTDEAHAQAILEAAQAETNRRVGLYKAHGGVRLDDIPAEQRPPHLVVVIDEVSEALVIPDKPPTTAAPTPGEEADRLDRVRRYTVRSRIATLLNTLAATGRSAGVHLVLMGQALKADSLPKQATNLKTNSNMCLLGGATDGQRRSGLINPDAAPDPGDDVPPGRGVWDPRLGVPEVVQFWYAPHQEYHAWLDAHLPVADPWDVSRFVPTEADMVGFAITTGSPATGTDGHVEELAWDAAGVDWDFDAPTPQAPDVAHTPVVAGDTPVVTPPVPVWDLLDTTDTDPVPPDALGWVDPAEDDEDEGTRVAPSPLPPPVVRRPPRVSMADLVGGA